MTTNERMNVCSFRIASENARLLLSECVASHLQHNGVTSEYGSRLESSGGRILLQSSPGIKQQGGRYLVLL
jgi:hypothetical protein